MARAQREAAPAVSLPTPVDHHSMALRRGAPGQSYSTTDARGIVTEIRANADGVIRPQTGEQVRVADAHRLPYWSDPLQPWEELPTTDAELDEPAEDISKLTVPVLQSRLAEAGLETAGKKPELVERLGAYLEAEAAAAAAADDEPIDEEPDEPDQED